MKLRFDRGTIVLADLPSGVNFAAAPGVLWDRRVRAYRAPASRYVALTRWLRAGGIRFQDISPRPRSVAAAWAGLDLRSYQEAALSAWELGSAGVSSRSPRGAARRDWLSRPCSGRS